MFCLIPGWVFYRDSSPDADRNNLGKILATSSTLTLASWQSLAAEVSGFVRLWLFGYELSIFDALTSLRFVSSILDQLQRDGGDGQSANEFQRSKSVHRSFTFSLIHKNVFLRFLDVFFRFLSSFEGEFFFFTKTNKKPTWQIVHLLNPS